MAYLIIQSGKQKGQAFKLDKCPLSAGREVTRDIQVVDPKVSRKHFIVDQDKSAGPDTYTIVAVSQTNGVHVNGTRIDAATRLANGDYIRVGDTEIVFVASDPARIDALKRFREFSAATRAATQRIQDS
jgi:pSer/pThr/pTyr-binding forkhead associated (FHA) protein